MYRKFLGRSKRIAAIALAGAMVFSSMTAYAKEQEQAVSAAEVQEQTVSAEEVQKQTVSDEEQQADAAVVQSEQDKIKSTIVGEEKKTDSEAAKKEEKKTISSAKKLKQETKAAEEYAPTATTEYKEWMLKDSMWVKVDPQGGEIKQIQIDLYKGDNSSFGTSSLPPKQEIWSDGSGQLTFDEEWLQSLREVLSHTNVKLEDMTRLDITIQFIKDGVQKDVTIKMPLRQLSTETGKPHFVDRVMEGDALIGDNGSNVSPAYVYFGNAGTEEINLSDYEFKARGVKNCENVDLKVDYISSEPVKPGQQVEFSNSYVAVTGFFPKEYTKESAKFVVDVYAKNAPETLLYTTKEMTIYPYKIVTTDEGRVLQYNDSSHYSKYEVKIETDEHCKLEDLVGGGRGDSTEIWEKGERTGIFLRTGYPSAFMMSYDEGYVFGTAKLDPADAGTVEMASGSGTIYEVDLHKPATLKVTSSTEAALEGEYGLKFVTDGNAENASTLSNMEMNVKTYEDNFDWLKRYFGANGEILAYESTVKIKDDILQNSPDLKMDITGNVPRIYIPIPDGWDKEKIGVFYEYDMYSNAKTAEVTEDGKYVIAYPEGFDKEFAKVTTKVGIFEKIDATVAKDWETVAYNYIERMRSVNWMEQGNPTFDQRFFEGTAKANDVSLMTLGMENEKYVENYRVGESYSLEIPYDVLVKDAGKYYKNVPDLKQTNMKGFFYYDAEKNAFIAPEGGVGDAPPTVKVVKVDELGNKTYAIRFEFTDNIEAPTYESEATLVVEDNGQGNWRYISFLKGYPEIAPIEPEKPEEPEKPTDPTPDKPSTNDPIVNPDTGKELSQTVVDKVVEKVENAKKGSEVVVKMQGATTVPSEVLKSVKGKDVDVVLDMGGYSWAINGKEVTADKLKDINLKVTMNSNAIPQSVVEKTADGDPVIQISLAHDGAFGFQADLKMNVGAKYKGLYAKLYYYNEEGKLGYVQSDKVEADGTVIFTFKHASDYAIIFSKKDDAANTGSKTENTTPKTGDTSPLAIYVCMMLLAGGLVVFVGRRRFCK